MTVAENVVLGWSTSRRLRFSPRTVEKAVAEAAERFQMPVDPRGAHLAVVARRAATGRDPKALYRGAKILILDEPTTVLTPQEADQLFSSVRDMAAAGRTVIFISHKLPEVLAVADRVTILASGPLDHDRPDRRDRRRRPCRPDGRTRGLPRADDKGA